LYFFSGTVVAFRLGVTAGAGVALAVAVAGMMSKERGAMERWSDGGGLHHLMARPESNESTKFDAFVCTAEFSITTTRCPFWIWIWTWISIWIGK
jgi:TctA family transporter